MLEATDITKSFGGLAVLRGVSLAIERGEVVALIGPSGSGKSTFLRCVNQLEKVDGGSISLDGDVMCAMEGTGVRYGDEKTLRKITLRMGMVFQGFHLFPHRSVLQNLMDAPMAVRKIPRAQARAKAGDLLKKVGLSDKAAAMPCQLSGGQAQRVAIARALFTRPEIIIFDEATSALDQASENIIASTIAGLSEKTTVIIIAHRLTTVENCDRLIWLESGKLRGEGTPAKILPLYRAAMAAKKVQAL